MPGSDFFPSTDGDLVLHLQNYRDKLPSYGKSLAWAPASIKASQERCTRVIEALHATEQRRAEYQAQVETTREVKKTDLAALRADIRLIKASGGYSDAMGRELGLIATAAPQGRADGGKASAKAELRGGTVRIRWTKGRLDGVNVYMRRQGDSEWALLGRDTHSPYDDSSPLGKAGVPEQREYRVVGVKKDLEVGAPSDIVSVVVSA